MPADKLAYVEIAEILGRKEEAVRQLARRAREHVREATRGERKAFDAVERREDDRVDRVGRNRKVFPVAEPELFEPLEEAAVDEYARLVSLDQILRMAVGDVDDEDKAENTLSVEKGFRILSAYHLYGQKIWLITEADRSRTAGRPCRNRRHHALPHLPVQLAEAAGERAGQP